MHRVYAEHFGRAGADFALNVRRTPVALSAIRAQHPRVWARLCARACAELQRTPPLPPAVLCTLRELNDECVKDTLLRRAAVAPVSWVDVDGEPVAVASGE